MRLINFTDIDSVNFDQPLRNGIKPLEELGQRGFARTGPADKTDRAPFRYLQRKTLDDLGQVRTVLKRDVFKLDPSFQSPISASVKSP